MKLEDGTDDPAWLKWRAEGVTATDVADAFAGTYGGMYGVVARKLGLEVVEENAEMQRGHDWEPTIADAVSLLFGCYVVGEETMWECADDPRWRCTSDGALARVPEASLDDLFASYEAKTVRPDQKWKLDRWRTQTQWQQLVLGLPRALLAIARIDDSTGECVGITFEWVEADPYLQAQLVELAETIWGHMQAGTLPDPDTPSALESVKQVTAHADPDAEAVDLTDLEADVARFADIKAAEKAVTDERKLLEARIRNTLGEATKGSLDGYRVSLSKPRRILTDAAEAELLAAHPEFAVERLDKDRVKAEDKALYDSFTQPVGARSLSVGRVEQ